MKVIKFLIKSLLVGVVTILLLNFFGQWLNFNIPFNLVNISLIGIFYLPGLLLVLLILIL